MTPLTLNFLQSKKFLINAIHSIFLYIYRFKIDTIYHFTNSSDEFKIGKDSDRNYVMAARIFFFYMCNMIWKTGADNYYYALL